MNALEVIEVGDALGVVLPDERLARLKLGEGDTVFLIETANGFRLTKDDSDGTVQLPPAQLLEKKPRPVNKPRPQNKK